MIVACYPKSASSLFYDSFFIISLANNRKIYVPSLHMIIGDFYILCVWKCMTGWLCNIYIAFIKSHKARWVGKFHRVEQSIILFLMKGYFKVVSRMYPCLNKKRLVIMLIIIAQVGLAHLQDFFLQIDHNFFPLK